VRLALLRDHRTARAARAHRIVDESRGASQGCRRTNHRRTARDAADLQLVLALRRRRVDLRVLVALSLAAHRVSTHATATEPHGFHVWFAVCGGIGAWIVHLTALSALARRTCVTGEDWVLHALTVGLAAVTVLAMVLSARLRVPAGAGAPEPERTDLHFLGKMGLLIGAINLVLILFEGALVF